MSAFVVADETINKVLHLLDCDGAGNLRGRFGEVTGREGRELLELNKQAVAHRYRDSYEPETEPFSWTLRAYSKFEMLKAADCYLYQCNEGEQFREAAWYKVVTKAADRMRRAIVNSMPEYDAAPWG